MNHRIIKTKHCRQEFVNSMLIFTYLSFSCREFFSKIKTEKLYFFSNRSFVYKKAQLKFVPVELVSCISSFTVVFNLFGALYLKF